MIIVTYGMFNWYIYSEIICGILLEFPYLGCRLSYGTVLIGLLSRILSLPPWAVYYVRQRWV